MRIPFIRGRLVIGQDRVQFIQTTKGGSAFLIAGAIFWFVASISSLVLPVGQAVNVYVFGGFSVFVVGFMIARLQGARMFSSPQYATLAAIASIITPFCFPVLLLVAHDDPQLLPSTLTIIDGAHLMVFMWLHLDYTYFLASVAKFFVGAIYIWSLHTHALLIVGLASALISTIAAVMVWRSSRDPLAGYRRAGVKVQVVPFAPT
jgi:hypothetical protein